MPVYNEYDYFRFETIPEYASFTAQLLSLLYPVILGIMLYLRPLRNRKMSIFTAGILATGLGYDIFSMIYDWITPYSNYARFFTLLFAHICLLLTSLQQLEILKAFVLLSEKIHPNQIYNVQWWFMILTVIVTIGSVFEDIVALVNPNHLPFFILWAHYGRAFQAVASTILTNICSLYMLLLVYRNVSKKNKDREAITRNLQSTIRSIFFQFFIDIVGGTIFIISSFSVAVTSEEMRTANALGRMASSLILARVIFQYWVFLNIMQIKFYRYNNPTTRVSKKSKVKTINEPSNSKVFKWSFDDN
jgi:glycerol uptake facilitator-like aquaporin